MILLNGPNQLKFKLEFFQFFHCKAEVKQLRNVDILTHL